MLSRLNVFEGICRRNGFNSGSFRRVGLVEPEMEMALARNQSGMGFVVYQGEIDNSRFDHDLVAGDGLIRSRGYERERGTTQGQSSSN